MDGRSSSKRHRSAERDRSSYVRSGDGRDSGTKFRRVESADSVKNVPDTRVEQSRLGESWLEQLEEERKRLDSARKNLTETQRLFASLVTKDGISADLIQEARTWSDQAKLEVHKAEVSVAETKGDTPQHKIACLSVIATLTQLQKDWKSTGNEEQVSFIQQQISEWEQVAKEGIAELWEEVEYATLDKSNVAKASTTANGVEGTSRRASDGGTSIASIQLPSKSDHEYTSRSSQRSSDRTDLTDKINRSDYVDKPERTDYDRSSLSTASRDIRSLVERPKDNDRRSQSRESRAAVDRPRTGRVPVVKRDAVETRKEASNAKFPPNSNEKHENQVDPIEASDATVTIRLDSRSPRLSDGFAKDAPRVSKEESDELQRPVSGRDRKSGKGHSPDRRPRSSSRSRDSKRACSAKDAAEEVFTQMLEFKQGQSAEDLKVRPPPRTQDATTDRLSTADKLRLLSDQSSERDRRDRDSRDRGDRVRDRDRERDWRKDRHWNMEGHSVSLGFRPVPELLLWQRTPPRMCVAPTRLSFNYKCKNGDSCMFPHSQAEKDAWVVERADLHSNGRNVPPAVRSRVHLQGLRLRLCVHMSRCNKGATCPFPHSKSEKDKWEWQCRV